jgi:tRNA(Ile)-lysidine synthase
MRTASLDAQLQQAVADALAQRLNVAQRFNVAQPLTLDKQSNIVVALSGGLDSVVLLHLCAQLHLKLSAVHVNHGISANADAWQAHCQALCDSLSIPLYTQSLCIIKRPRTSLEEQARSARYQAIIDTVPPKSIVLLAQHQDDQAETFLLQLARGAGPKGLSAMPAVMHTQEQRQFVRPLLGFSRQQLYQYAKAHDLQWVEDESNQDLHFDRNFIRHTIMPELSRRWPAMPQSIARSAQHCADYVEVAESYIAILAQETISDSGELVISEWQQASPAAQNMLLRLFLKPHVTQSPSTAFVHQLKRLIASKADAQGECRWQDIAIRRYLNKLYVINASALAQEAAHSPASIPVHFDDKGVFEHPSLPYRIERRTSCDPSSEIAHINLGKGALSVEFGGFQRLCKLDAKRPSKTVKTWLQEWQIPPWARIKVPILMQDNCVVALGKSPAIVTGTNKSTADIIVLVDFDSTMP